MENNQLLLIVAALGLGVGAYYVYTQTQMIDPATTALSTQQAKLSRDFIMSKLS
jgi:uncharacterized protein HemX